MYVYVGPADSNVPAPVIIDDGWKSCVPQLHIASVAPCDTLKVPMLLPLPNNNRPACIWIRPLLLKEDEPVREVSPVLVLVTVPKLLNVAESMVVLFWIVKVASA